MTPPFLWSLNNVLNIRKLNLKLRTNYINEKGTYTAWAQPGVPALESLHLRPQARSPAWSLAQIQPPQWSCHRSQSTWQGMSARCGQHQRLRNKQLSSASVASTNAGLVFLLLLPVLNILKKNEERANSNNLHLINSKTYILINLLAGKTNV